MLGGLSAKNTLPHVSFRLSVDLFAPQIQVVVLWFHTLQLVGLICTSKTSCGTSYVYSSLDFYEFFFFLENTRTKKKKLDKSNLLRITLGKQDMQVLTKI
jgi:hypothetical protein